MMLPGFEMAVGEVPGSAFSALGIRVRPATDPLKNAGTVSSFDLSGFADSSVSSHYGN